MLPAQRREVLEQGLIHGLAVLSDRSNRPLQIDRVPEHDGRRHQVQATGAVSLVLEAPVAHLAQAVEEHGAGQGVSGLALLPLGLCGETPFPSPDNQDGPVSLSAFLRRTVVMRRQTLCRISGF